VEALYAYGTAGRILKMLKYPDNSVRILVQGLRRIELVDYIQVTPASAPGSGCSPMRPNPQRTSKHSKRTLSLSSPSLSR